MLHTREPEKKLPLYFDDISRCRTDGREQKIALCSLDGTLIRSTYPFAYFMLLAFESGSLARAFMLLAAFPVSLLLRFLVSNEAAMQMLVFITFSGLKASTVEFLSKAVLAKSYFRDMNPRTLSALVSFGKKYMVTAAPRIMVEPFLKEYLGVESVVGTELQVLSNGYCTGLIQSGSLLLSGRRKLEALKNFFETIHVSCPDTGFGSSDSDYPFMSWCKVKALVFLEAYKAIQKSEEIVLPSSAQERIKPLVFHDGRLAVLPTPAMALAIFLWTPLAIVLALLRILVPHTPYSVMLPLAALLGIKLRIKGSFPPKDPAAPGKLLFASSHRTLLDPVVLSGVLGREVTAVTYSISRLSELLSSIKTVRLSRNRASDSRTMRRLLSSEDVVVCPEGTTCREPYLLRFSPLFAEVSDNIVPVVMYAEMGLFYGTTARGWKWMDPFFFCMNVQPSYTLEFLQALPDERTCGRGKRTSVEVANYVQEELARASGLKPTALTRKDKYQFLTFVQ
ncbi:hypothetical protein SELMODRAFT_94909 [Selaginella moellendorffii]|uniref:Phospholipid/glycerol acyltransferase domain-containing protein n=1 Tax=Selaginella moellendorffii TaxID=88036 RepID=D8RJI2_SELML|nr:hypothetical protein SELMODRAFT_94909 [Selaginella moellendorffii]